MHDSVVLLGNTNYNCSNLIAEKPLNVNIGEGAQLGGIRNSYHDTVDCSTNKTTFGNNTQISKHHQFENMMILSVFPNVMTIILPFLF